jgi:hypothetical protein
MAKSHVMISKGFKVLSPLRRMALRLNVETDELTFGRLCFITAFKAQRDVFRAN